MGLADIHQYPPSEFALHNSDLILVIGARLDNQLNFGNPPFFPESTKLVCVNGSHEELELNRAADLSLLSDPGVFLDTLSKLKKNNKWSLDTKWFQENKKKKKEWIDKSLKELEIEAEASKKIPGSLSKLKSAALLSSNSSCEPFTQTNFVVSGIKGGFPKFN